MTGDVTQAEDLAPQQSLELQAGAALAQPRVLEVHELQAIAGGPTIDNQPQ